MSNFALDYLDRLMVARLCVVRACTKTFEAGFVLSDAVLPVPRLILVREGAMDYELDGQRWRVETGERVLVPAFFKRSWRACDDRPVTISWFEFDVDGELEQLPGLYASESPASRADEEAMERIAALFEAGPGEYSLVADGEMKAVLARFLSGARSPMSEGRGKRGPGAAETAVAEAARWMAKHYAKRDALERAMERSRLSENHYRLMFKRRVGLTPTQYLTQVRMRVARYRLQETGALVKEVARAVGFADPFHFSRAYRKYWGRSPREESGKAEVGSGK